MTTNGGDVKPALTTLVTPSVQFALCAPNANRRNSAPVIIKPPIDFSTKEKHLNFVSLTSHFPESPSPEEMTSPISFESKKINRSPVSIRSNSSQLSNKSPIKSPTYQRTHGPGKSPKSPNASNHFKFPPKKLTNKIDEYAVYENFSAYQPISPTNVNYVPTSPQRKSRMSSRQSSTSASGPRGSLSSTTSIPRSEISFVTESSIDSVTSSLSRCRRSTSDLTDLTEECFTENMSLSRPSSPRGRTGSIKGESLTSVQPIKFECRWRALTPAFEIFFLFLFIKPETQIPSELSKISGIPVFFSSLSLPPPLSPYHVQPQSVSLLCRAFPQVIFFIFIFCFPSLHPFI